MTDWLWIAAGGACGALARHSTNLLAARYLGTGFPYGTLAVNVVGCFLMGAIWQSLTQLDAAQSAQPVSWRPVVQHGLATGFLGALTTFSACRRFCWPRITTI